MMPGGSRSSARLRVCGVLVRARYRPVRSVDHPGPDHAIERSVLLHARRRPVRSVDHPGPDHAIAHVEVGVGARATASGSPPGAVA